MRLSLLNPASVDVLAVCSDPSSPTILHCGHTNPQFHCECPVASTPPWHDSALPLLLMAQPHRQDGNEQEYPPELRFVSCASLLCALTTRPSSGRVCCCEPRKAVVSPPSAAADGSVPGSRAEPIHSPDRITPYAQLSNSLRYGTAFASSHRCTS